MILRAEEYVCPEARQMSEYPTEHNKRVCELHMGKLDKIE